MKIKNVLLIGCLSLIFLGCNTKEFEEVKNQKILLEKENQTLRMQIEDLQRTISNLEEEKKNCISKQSELEQRIENLKKETEVPISLNSSFVDASKYEVHDLKYTLNFEYGGFNTPVYFSPETQDVIYTIQTGDIVDVSMFIHVIEINKDFIAVTVNNVQKGYIRISGNPYKNGNFNFTEKIEVDGFQVSILKMEKSFTVSDGINMKLLPSDNSENIHMVTHKEGGDISKSFFITSDYKWVKMMVGDYFGWVPASVLSADRGGPTLETPEEYIYFDLIGGNLI